MNEYIQPFLKWAGGKYHLKKHIIPMCPKFNTYYEPFVGSGVILFALHPKKAVINDINRQLCKTYETVKNHPDELIEKLKEHEKQDTREYYYKLRDLDRHLEYYESMDDIDKAARLIYLNKACYNGLYRVNLRNEFNTPYDNRGFHNIFDENVIRGVSEYFRSNDIIIRNMDFVDAVKDAKEGDFIYFDPPYYDEYHHNFVKYNTNMFTEKDHEKLEKLMENLTDKNVKCLLSNSCTKFVKDLYSNTDYFVIREIKSCFSIGSVANRRKKVSELLISNMIEVKK